MKARVKSTGAIIEVIPYSGFDEYDFYEPETKMPWFKSELDFEVTNKDEIYNKGWADGWYYTIQYCDGNPLISQLTLTDELYKTYEEALLKGIKEAVKILKEK